MGLLEKEAGSLAVAAWEEEEMEEVVVAVWQGTAEARWVRAPGAAAS
jgi:hypothetical protein